MRDTKQNKQLQYAQNARSLLESGNPIAEQASRTQIARLSGEVGVLTDADVNRFGGKQSVAAKLQQAGKKLLTGELTKENRELLITVARRFEEAAKMGLNNRLLTLAQGQSAAYRVDVNNIMPLVTAYSAGFEDGGGDAPTTEETTTTAQPMKIGRFTVEVE